MFCFASCLLLSFVAVSKINHQISGNELKKERFVLLCLLFKPSFCCFHQRARYPNFYRARSRFCSRVSCTSFLCVPGDDCKSHVRLDHPIRARRSAASQLVRRPRAKALRMASIAANLFPSCTLCRFRHSSVSICGQCRRRRMNSSNARCCAPMRSPLVFIVVAFHGLEQLGFAVRALWCLSG